MEIRLEDAARLLLRPCPKCHDLRTTHAEVVEKLKRNVTIDGRRWDSDKECDMRVPDLRLGDIHCGDCADTGFVPTELAQLLLSLVETYGRDGRKLKPWDVENLLRGIPF